MIFAIILMVSANWKTDLVTVVLHRSASMAAPENTIPALEEAVRQGADAVEIDIRRTQDGHLVLFHDDWLICHQGAGSTIEDLTLTEARSLDVGHRWGQRWNGLRTPLVKDVFSFAKHNNLRLFLDIKSKGIEAQLRTTIAEAGVSELIIHPKSLAPADQLGPKYISGWNYLDGGEEDPSTMAKVAASAVSQGSFVMVDDARALTKALGRMPELRHFSPFKESRLPRSPIIMADLHSSQDGSIRRALWKLNTRMTREASDIVVELAKSSRSPRVRLDAIWALGAMGDLGVDAADEIKRLLSQIAVQSTELDPKGMTYFPTFRQAAAACALARLGGKDELKALARQGGFLYTSTVMAATVYDRSSLVFDLLALPTSGDDSSYEGTITFALVYAALHPNSVRIFAEGLKSGGYNRKIAVFGLASQLTSNRDATSVQFKDASPLVNSGLRLAKAWSESR